VNLTLTFLKKRRREKGRDVFSEDHSFNRSGEASNASPEKYSLKMELTERLNKAIDSLPLLYKTPFILVVFQGMTHAQAAGVLSCSENTVSWRMFKARKMLQTKLSPYLEEG
jgi:RNA polymerase sigma-70 factor (ECF subfamily)